MALPINITGHHVDITDPIRDYTNKRLSGLNKYNDSITHCDVVLTVEKDRHKAEASIHIPGKTVHAHHETDSGMYEAIDKLQTKLGEQLRKDKEKRSNHRH